MPSTKFCSILALLTAVTLGAAPVYNVKDFGARGNGVDDDTQSIQKALHAMTSAPHGSVLHLPDGQYLISGKLLAEKLSNITISGDHNTELLRANIGFDTIMFTDCDNINVKNLTFRTNQQLTVSGNIISQDNRNTISVKVPALDKFALPGTRIMMQIYFPNGMQDHRFHRTEVTTITPNASGNFTVSITIPLNGQPEANEKAAFFIRGGRPVINMANCSNSTFEDVTVVNGGDLAWGLRFCNGMTFRRCRIGQPLNSGLLVSTGADGIHSKHARKGHLVENCDFSGMSDDDLNFSTTLSNIARISDKQTVIVGDNTDYRVGDRVAVFDPATATNTQLVKVVGVKKVSWNSMNALQVDFDQALHVKNTLETMKLSKPFKLLFGHTGELPGMLYNLEAAHAGSIIRNNRFGNNRARGLLLRTADTIIENNRFYNLRGPAILMASEGMWLECGRIENVTIRNNTFDGISRSPILFSSIAYTSKRVNSEKSSRNLTITDNYFVNCGSPAIEGSETFGLFGNLIMLENVTGARVADNRFAANSPLALPLDKVIVNHCDAVTLENNRDVTVPVKPQP